MSRGRGVQSTFVESLPRAFGGVAGSGLLRSRAEDFFVDEIGSVEPSGSGEHVLLQIEKRDSNTLWLVQQLARHAGVAPRDVGYAGQKDRRALTRQWFSVRMAGRSEPDWEALNSEVITVLRVERHHRKLKTGALRGNRFKIRLRDWQGDQEKLRASLALIRTRGVPNYFGEQRFGHGESNLHNARALFAGELKRTPRHKRSHYLSAARSMLFNRILAQRVEDLSWDRILVGERCLLDGSRSSFLCEQVDQQIMTRCSEMDIHPSGALWGRGEHSVSAEVLELEQRLIGSDTELSLGLEKYGVEQERRSLRMKVSDLVFEMENPSQLCLEFSLPRGCFATALLRELVDYRVDPPSQAVP